MLPFVDTAPRPIWPTITIGLAGFALLTLAWMLTLGPAEFDQALLRQGIVPVRYARPDLARTMGLDPSDWWPFLTATFMHGGFLHLLSNMWALWLFGPAMEARLARFGFVLLYFVGGAAAGVAQALVHPNSGEPVVTASGAVAAVIAAYVASYPTARLAAITPLGGAKRYVTFPAIAVALVWLALQIAQRAFDAMTPSLAGTLSWQALGFALIVGALTGVLANLFGIDARGATPLWQDKKGR